jgi:hypothetical protein
VVQGQASLTSVRYDPVVRGNLDAIRAALIHAGRRACRCRRWPRSATIAGRTSSTAKTPSARSSSWPTSPAAT